MRESIQETLELFDLVKRTRGGRPLPGSKRAERWQQNIDSMPISKDFPGFERVYLLGEPGGSRAFRADIDLSVDESLSIMRCEAQVRSPVVCRWFMGGHRPRDIVWTSLACPLLVSERVVSVLTTIGAKGWSTYPVCLLGKGGEKITGYQGLAIPGRCGPIEYARSTKVVVQYPGRATTRWNGMFFDSNSWTGDELFMPDGKNGLKVVTERVKSAFEGAQIEDMRYTRLSEVLRSSRAEER